MRFANGLQGLGCTVAIQNRRRLKAVLPDKVEIRDLYLLAQKHEVAIRRLDFKRDSLEDIFLKAMEGDPEAVREAVAVPGDGSGAEGGQS